MSASLVNEKLDEYSLILEKFEKETPKPLEGALFTVKGKWLNQDFTTDENGTFEVGPLYVGIEYTIEEVVPPTGYALSDNIVRFVVNKDEEGKPYLQILEGEIKPSADFENEKEEKQGISTYGAVLPPKIQSAIDKDGNPIDDKEAVAILDGDKISQIGIAIDNEPLFSLTKVDGETQKPLPNVKFAIKKVEDDGTESQALNSKGEVIGETQEIDGKTYQVITTDKDGRITEDLPEGYYKVVEVETLEGYQLPENEEDRTYFFGIGKTKPAVKEIVELWSQQFEGNGEITYTDSVATDDGGYVVIGDIYKNVVIEAKDTENNEDILLPNSTYKSGVIIKYNSEDKIEWARTILENINENMASIEITDEGEFVIAGNVGKTTIKADNTENGEDIKINEGSYNQQAFIMLCNNQGRVKWIERINNGTLPSQYNGIKVVDNGYVCVGYTNADITIPADKTTNNQEIIIDYTEGSTSNSGDMIAIKYDKEGKIEWATSIGGTANDIAVDLEINEQEEIVIIGNTNSSNINIDKSKMISNNEFKLELNGTSSSFITKINSDGKIIWIKKLIGLDNGLNTIHSIEKVEEGYIVVGEGSGYKLTSDETKDGSDKQEAFRGASGEIMKYTEDGLIDWIYSSGVGYLSNIVNIGNEKYAAVGGVSWFVNLAGKTAEGYSPSFDSKGTYDAIIIRYNENGKIEKINRLEDKDWRGQYSKVNIDKEGNIIVLGSISGVSNINIDEQNKKIIGAINVKYDKELNLINSTDRNKSTNEIFSAIATNDGGNISVGRFSEKLEISSEKTVTGENIELYSNGKYDCFSVKYNSEGLVENATVVGGGYEDVFYGITKVSDGYIAVGRVNEQYTSKDVIISGEYTQDGENITIDNIGNPYGIIIKYNEEGKIIWGKSIISTLDNIKAMNDGGYIVIGENGRTNKIPAEMTAEGQEVTLSTKGVVVLKFNSDDKIEWYSNIGESSNFYLQNLDINFTNEIFAVGYFSGTINIDGSNTEDGEPISLTSNSGAVAITIKYNTEGKVVWATTDFRCGNLMEENIVATEDGGYIKVWHGFTNTGLTIDGDKTVDGQDIPLTGGWTTYLIKYNEENKVEYVKKTSLSQQNGINYLISTNDGGYLGVGGIGTEDNSGILIIKYDKDLNEEGITLQAYSSQEGRYEFVTEINDDEFLIIGNRLNNGQKSATVTKIKINTISAEIPEQQSLTIENHKKEYKITTDVDGVGGTISGQGSTNDNPYETVEDGGDSTKDIVITPEPGYKVLEITVNGEKIEFIPEEDGSVILDKFINMTSDKHVVVQFSNSVSTVIVHHYKDGTTEKLAKDETLTGEIGTNYTTAPKDIENYEVVIEKLPSNASGQYKEDEQEVIYYYKQSPVKLIVHHYLEGTEEIVPGSEDDQINEERERNSEYTTSPAKDIDAKYELVATPSNASGKLTENETVVTYYYRVKDSAGVIVHHIDTDTKEQIASDIIIPANETGKYGDSYTTEISDEVPANYEYVSKTDNWEGTMIDKLTEVTYEYKLVDPTIRNGVEKTATLEITSKDDEITYDIAYRATIENYIGKAQVTIVDTIPYAIDMSKSTLDGGTYNAKTNTITWKEVVDGIDTYENPESGEILINKTIKVVYTNVDTTQETIVNNVSGQVKLLTPEKTSEKVTDKAETRTKFTLNIPVAKIWDDEGDKLGNRPTSVIFKLTGSDGSVYTKELSVPGTAGSTTTQDSNNPNKWNDIFENLPKYDANRNEIEYTLTEEEKNEDDLQYYEATIDNENKSIVNKDTYGKVTVHYYIIDNEGKKTTNRVPDEEGNEVPDIIIEGQEGNEYETEPAEEVSEKYELVQTELPENADGTIEKYNPEKEQVVIYYYRLKPAKVIINYLEKDEDSEDSNNVILSEQEEIDGYVDDKYNTDEKHKKETITKDGKKYTLVEDSGNTEGTMTVDDINVTYYYLQNTKATVRYVARDPETHEITKELEEPYTEEGLVGDEFVTNEKAFIGYKLVEAPKDKTIQMTKDEQVLIYYYEPVYTGLVENHIDIINGNVLYTEIHEVQVGDDYNIPSKEFAGYDLVEEKLPDNSTGTMGEELVTVNYYYIKKAVLEVNYIDQLTGKPLDDKIVDNSKHEGDKYETEQKDFDGYDFIKVEGKPEGTMQVEVDEDGNIVNNKTVVTYYYAKKAQIEEHHIDIRTGKELEEPTVHNGHVGDEYNIPWEEFLSYEVVTKDEDGKNMLPENAEGKYTEEKQVITYYYYQPAKVIVHYVDMTTNEELQETNKETGKVQSSQVVIEGSNQVDYETEAKEFPYYTLVEKDEEGNSLLPENAEGKMKVEITKDENGKDIVKNTIDVYYYYEPKPFNIGVEKEIIGIIVDGESRTPTNGKLERVEIYRKDVEKARVQVEYKIKVINSGEVEGAVTMEDRLPEGMSLANNDGTWEEQDGVLRKIIPEINPGETKEYTVVLNWNTAETNMGEKDNVINIVDTQNVPGFVDNNDKDNTSNANVIIAVETGELPIGLILTLVALVGLETVTLRYAVVLTKRQKKNK